MTFLAPFMLFGAAAAAIPIALHFFFRSRFRIVPWAAMRFLLDSIEQTSRRLRFQELLLLLARVLILVMLALALSRPLFSAVRGAGRGEAVDAVFVFDTSYSMGGHDGAQTRFERAQAKAIDIIDQLPAHSTVQVITCSDQAAVVGPRTPGNLDQARTLIQELKLTSLATDLYPGALEASSVLDHGLSTNKEFYLFSDMQTLGWDKQASNLTGILQELRSKATIYLVHCGGKEPLANVTVADVAPEQGVPRPGQRLGYAIVLKNSGTEVVRDIKVSLSADGADKTADTTAVSSLNAGESRAVALTAKFDKPGLHILTARIAHDDMEGDNRLDKVILVRPQVNVLVVDGKANEREARKTSSFYLAHALLPVQETERVKYYMQLKIVPPRLAAPSLLEKQDICILANAAIPGAKATAADTLPNDFLEELGKFVRGGHGLVIFAGDNVVPDSYNRQFGQKLGLLPMPIKGIIKRAPKSPIYIDRTTANLPSLRSFKEDERFKDFSDTQVFQALDLQEHVKKATGKKDKDKDNEKDAAQEKDKEGLPPSELTKDDALTIALRYSNGAPAVVIKKVDAGEVVLVTTAAEPGQKADSPTPTWSEFPYRWEYTPFINVLVAYLLDGQTQNHNLVAGRTLQWYPTEAEVRAYTLIQPDGHAVRLGLPETLGKRKVVTATDFPVAGIYRLRTSIPANDVENEIPVEDALPIAGDLGIPLAVIPDLRESESLESLTQAQIDARLGFSPVHLVAGSREDAAAAGLPDRISQEWTIWLLALVLLLALGESTLAYICDRAA